MNNLFSVAIVVKKEHIQGLKQAIIKLLLCLVGLCEKGKIIVVIESENLEEELNTYKMLENLPNIISINMVFSYQNLEDDIQKAPLVR